MSSFNINGPSSNQPLVQGSQNLGKDGGGGGNTGFMNMRNKKKGQDKKEEDNSVFLEEEIEDTFEKEGGLKKNKDGKILGALANFIKKDKKQEKDNKQKPSDSFQKTEPNDEEEVYEDYSQYNVPLNKPVDPLEDDEYEIVEDDGYYDDIDV